MSYFSAKRSRIWNLDATILTVDPALAVVGGSSKDEDEAQPTRPKRKLFQCSISVRSFSEEEKLVQHIDTEHFYGIIFRLTFVCLDNDHDGVYHNKHFKTWNKNDLVGQNRSQLSIRFLVKISRL